MISELRRRRPDAQARAFVAGQPLEDLFVSTVTLAEIRYGIEMIGDPIRRAELNNWLAHRVRPMFDQCVLEVSEEVMFTWRLLVEDGRKAAKQRVPATQQAQEMKPVPPTFASLALSAPAVHTAISISNCSASGSTVSIDPYAFLKVVLERLPTQCEIDAQLPHRWTRCPSDDRDRFMPFTGSMTFWGACSVFRRGTHSC